MKERVLPLLLMLLLLSLGSCGNADDDSYLPPNTAVVATLYKVYPSAENVEWSQKGVYYVANCYVQDTEQQVWIDANANWVQTEIELFREDLPASVNTAFAQSDYGSFPINEITLLTYPMNPYLYVIEIEEGSQEIALFYSIYGGLLHVRDVTNSDDTFWPNMSLE